MAACSTAVKTMWTTPVVLVWCAVFASTFYQSAAADKASRPNSTTPTIHLCTGDDVTLTWENVTSDDVTATFWFSKKNGTFASFFAGRFATQSKRVKYVTDEGVTLSAVTADDSDTYGVQVLRGGKRYEYTQHVVVVEPPSIEGESLQVKQRTSKTGNSSCDSELQLQCGKFESVGVPAASVVWRDPEGKQLPSTGFKDGYFLLDLPRDPKGGNYTCRLTFDPEMSRCLKNVTSSSTQTLPSTSSSSPVTASVTVETAETKIEKQEKVLEQLQEDLHKIHHHSMGTQQDLMESLKTEMEERLNSLASSVDNVTYDLNVQKAAAQSLEQRVLNSTELSHNDLLASLADLEERMTTTIQSKVDEASSNLSETVSRSIAEQQETVTKQVSVVGLLQGQLATLKSDFQALQTLTSQLQTDLTSARQDLTTYKSTTEKLKRELQEQREVNAKLKTDLETQASGMANITSTLQEVGQMVDQQQVLSADLQSRQHTLQQDLSSLSARTDSAAKSLETDLESVQGNLTASVATLQETQRGLSQSCDAKVNGVIVTVRSLQTNVSQMSTGLADVTKTVSSQSALSSQLSTLQTTVTSMQTQYQSLAPRVTTLETNLQTVTAQVYPIRLVGGSNNHEGRVEIRVGSGWGTICDDDWGNEEAVVVCNMLGFLQSGAQARGAAAFGPGTGPIVLDDVACRGGEADIRLCPSKNFGTHNCAHTEDAGVVCVG